MRRRIELMVLLIASLLWAAPVRAHVRWFADDAGATVDSVYVFDGISILVILGAVLYALAAVGIHYLSARWR